MYHNLLLPLLIRTHSNVHLPSILPHSYGGYLPLGPTAPPKWRDTLSERPEEGPCTHATPHRHDYILLYLLMHTQAIW